MMSEDICGKIKGIIMNSGRKFFHGLQRGMSRQAWRESSISAQCVLYAMEG